MAKQSARIGADGIRIPLKRGDAKAALPAELAGTLVLTEKTGDGEVKQAFDVSAKLDPAFVPSSSLAAAEGSEPLSLVEALLFALLGGLILNLMPCVFPVLAMKAAAFVRLAGHERSAMRRDGIAYTAGVLVSFAAMAARRHRHPRQRRRGELGLPVPVADLLAPDRLSLLRGRPQPFRRVRDRRTLRRRRPGPGRRAAARPAPSSPACWR